MMWPSGSLAEELQLIWWSPGLRQPSVEEKSYVFFATLSRGEALFEPGSGFQECLACVRARRVRVEVSCVTNVGYVVSLPLCLQCLWETQITSTAKHSTSDGFTKFIHVLTVDRFLVSFRTCLLKL